MVFAHSFVKAGRSRFSHGHELQQYTNKNNYLMTICYLLCDPLI